MTAKAPASLLKRLSADVAWAAAAKLGTGVFQFCISLIMAQMMGVAAYGTFEFALRTLAVLLVVSNMGLTWKSLMLTSGGSDGGGSDGGDSGGGDGGDIGPDLSAVINTALLASVVISVGFVALLSATSGEHFAPGFAQQAVLLLMVPAFTLLLVISEAFRGLARIREASIFSGLFSNFIALAVLGGFYLVVGEMSVAGGLVVMAIAGSLAVSVAYAALRKAVTTLGWRFDWARMTQQARESLPFAVYNILVAVAATVDIWAVKALLSQQDVGLYGLASRLSQFFLIPWMIASAVFRGRIAKTIAQGNWTQLHQITARSTAALALICGAATGVFALAAGTILDVALPGAFAQSERAMVILALAFSIQATFSIYSLCLLFSARTGFKYIVPITQMALFAALAAPLSAQYALEGVAMAMLIAIIGAVLVQGALYAAAFPSVRAANEN